MESDSRPHSAEEAGRAVRPAGTTYRYKTDILHTDMPTRRVRAAGTTYRYKTDVLYPDILMLTRGARRLGLAARTRLPSGGCWITVAVTRLSCAATVTLLAGALLTAAAA